MLSRAPAAELERAGVVPSVVDEAEKAIGVITRTERTP
jgi:hypothetical protein